MMTTLNTLIGAMPAWLADTEIGKAAINAERRRQFEARSALTTAAAERAQQLAAAEAALQAATAPLQAKLETARKQVRALETQLAAAATKHARIIGEHRARINQLRVELARSADPSIATTRAALWDRYRRACVEGTVSRQEWRVVPGRVDDDLRPMQELVTNGSAVTRLLTAIKTASEALDRLTLQAPEDLPAAIAAICAPVEKAWDGLGAMEYARGPETHRGNRFVDIVRGVSRAR